MPYVDLEGVRGRRLNPRGKHMARTVTGLMAILKSGRICSAAGDTGAVTVWRDDKGQFRCDFSRHRVSVNYQTVMTKAAVRRWLVEWLPHTQRALNGDVESR